MRRINILDINTANKIAAGEVVERPSSVVKELVENSIDAGAKNIIVEIEEGGQKLIKVIDDGHGIHEDDLEKAFLPHATSKISKVEDIYAINTLGFRGEALPSIASVSKLHMKSKYIESNTAKEIILESGEVLSLCETMSPRGTIIEVADLFFNVPARQKFLKSSSREASLINEILSRIALSHPEISFEFINNNKKIFATYGNDKLIDVIRVIFGKNICDNITYFEDHTDIASVYGYIGNEEISRGSRSNQIIFVNRRYIKNKTIAVAVENAFKSFATVNKYPFFIIFIDIFPELVDVNIHPTKSEIKFKDERSIFKLVFDSVHKALRALVFDKFNIPEENKVYFKEVEKVEDLTLDLIPNKNVQYKIAEPKFSYKKEEDFQTPDQSNIISLPVDFLNKKNEFHVDNSCERTSESIEENIIAKDYSEPKLEVYANPKFGRINIIGQFNKTYIIGELDNCLYLIDQHAAHEKILFEKYINDIEKANIISQPLLVPTVLNLSFEDYAIFEENKAIFLSSGFLIEDFGGNSLVIKEIPYFLGKLDSKNLLIDIIDNLKNLGSGKPTSVKYNRIATMACKAAIKAKDELSYNEMEKLLEELRYIDSPFHCPHGRPTMIKFTLNEIEKKFKRIQ